MKDSEDPSSSPDDSSEARKALSHEAHSAIGGVLGLVTHDLRNPLAALSSNVGFLSMMGDEFSQDVQDAIFDLQLSVEALSRIVDALELVSHDLADAQRGAPLSLRVGDVLRSVLPAAQRAAQSHSVTLRAEFQAFADERFVASEAMFSRALMALLQNAISVAPSRSEVSLSVSREGDSLSFRVEDEGTALSPDLAEAAMTAVGQVEIKTTRGGRYSRGLGLYVVARSAELAGARLRVGEREGGSAIELICKQSV